MLFFLFRFPQTYNSQLKRKQRYKFLFMHVELHGITVIKHKLV